MNGLRQRSRAAIVGVADHGGWAVFVTATADGQLLDRRRVELVDPGQPKIPHHSEGQTLPIEEAVELVERVRFSAERHAKLALEALARALPDCVNGVALRECPAWLPATVSERIQDYRAQNVADWVMYRQAIAAAAEARGWAVHWYNAQKVLASASEALRIDSFEAYSLHLRTSVGPPWDKDHKTAMAAAIAAAHVSQPADPDRRTIV